MKKFLLIFSCLFIALLAMQTAKAYECPYIIDQNNIPWYGPYTRTITTASGCEIHYVFCIRFDDVEPEITVTAVSFGKGCDEEMALFNADKKGYIGNLSLTTLQFLTTEEGWLFCEGAKEQLRVWTGTLTNCESAYNTSVCKVFYAACMSKLKLWPEPDWNRGDIYFPPYNDKSSASTKIMKSSASTLSGGSIYITINCNKSLACATSYSVCYKLVDGVKKLVFSNPTTFALADKCFYEKVDGENYFMCEPICE